MAGPGVPGPPSRLDNRETVELRAIEADVLAMYDSNMTLREIASATGYAPSSIGVMLKRINARTLRDNDRFAVRAAKIRQLHKIQDALIPHVLGDGRPDFFPSDKLANVLLRAIKAEVDLVGSNAPTRIEFGWDEDDENGDGSVTTVPGQSEADLLNRWMELADKLAGPKGYGSGRVIDAQVVDDDEEADQGLVDPTKRVTGPGSEPPGVAGVSLTNAMAELSAGADIAGKKKPEPLVFADDTLDYSGPVVACDWDSAPEEDDDALPPMDGDMGDDAIGHWVDGQFVMTSWEDA